MAADFAATSDVRVLADESATIEAGFELAENLCVGSVVALTGDLGAGKTCVSRGIAQGLGFPGDVSSPTFTLVHEYTGGRLPVFHFDFYRLETVEELLDIGWDEYLAAGGVVIAEWADKFPAALPPETLWIALSHASDGSDRRELRTLAPPADTE